MAPPLKSTRQNRIDETTLMNLSSLASAKAAEAAFPDTHTVVGPETVGSFPRMDLSLLVGSRFLLFREFYCVRYTSLRVWQRTLTWYELFKW